MAMNDAIYFELIQDNSDLIVMCDNYHIKLFEIMIQ